MAQKKLLEERTPVDNAWLLVDVFFHAGEPLSAYIQEHSEVGIVQYIAAAAPQMPVP
jgi:hypothetical protein